MEIEAGTRVVLMSVRKEQPDPYNQPGWRGEVLAVKTVSEANEEASGYAIYEGDTYYLVRWDNKYESEIYPNEGDKIVLCKAN